MCACFLVCLTCSASAATAQSHTSRRLRQAVVRQPWLGAEELNEILDGFNSTDPVRLRMVQRPPGTLRDFLGQIHELFPIHRQQCRESIRRAEWYNTARVPAVRLQRVPDCSDYQGSKSWARRSKARAKVPMLSSRRCRDKRFIRRSNQWVQRTMNVTSNAIATLNPGDHRSPAIAERMKTLAPTRWPHVQALAGASYVGIHRDSVRIVALCLPNVLPLSRERRAERFDSLPQRRRRSTAAAAG